MKRVVAKHPVSQRFLGRKHHPRCTEKVSVGESTLLCSWHCACANPHKHSTVKYCVRCDMSRPGHLEFFVEDAKQAIHFETMEEAFVHVECIVEESPLGEVAKELILMWIELHE